MWQVVPDVVMQVPYLLPPNSCRLSQGIIERVHVESFSPLVSIAKFSYKECPVIDIDAEDMNHSRYFEMVDRNDCNYDKKLYHNGANVFVCIYIYIYIYMCVCKVLPEEIVEGHQIFCGNLGVQGVTMIYFFVSIFGTIETMVDSNGFWVETSLH